MEIIAKATSNWVWCMDGFGALVIVATRLWSNEKSTWALVGLILLTIAIGNVVIISADGLDASKMAGSLIGLVVYGSLGASFIGDWLTNNSV